MSFNGLSGVNVELTSRCNKQCKMCGRRKHEKDDPSVLNTYGDMPYSMVESIASQLPNGIITYLHWNGEPLLYPYFGQAVDKFSSRGCLVSCDTNGKLLVEKSDEIIGHLHTMAVSIIQDDPEHDEQLSILKEFLNIKGKLKPLVVARLNGEQDETPYRKLGINIAKRILHHPMGSFKYSRDVTIPECGVCMDLLHRLAIDRFGNISLCVRFDPSGCGILGNINEESIDEIWNGRTRAKIIENHLCGNRDFWKICSTCDFFGLPTPW